MKSCAENMENCRANCCRMVSFGFQHEPDVEGNRFLISNNREKIHYYTLHEGLKARGTHSRTVLTVDPLIRKKVVQRGDMWVLIVFSKCRKLTDEGKCSIYGKKERPVLCQKGYSEIKKNILFAPNCIYEPDQESLILKEEDLK